MVSVAVLTAFSAGFKSMDYAKAKTAAVALANEKMEEARNLPYDSLSTKNGSILPQGNIDDQIEVERDGVLLRANTTIMCVDDAYDGNVLGTIPSKPVDTNPCDYKRVEINVYKVGKNQILSTLSSNFAAKAAETNSNTGVLYICVVDEESNPVTGALVSIQNTALDPDINMSNLIVSNDGCIMIANLPPDTHNNYHLSVSKNGFSTDMTYPRTSQNPNALFPDVNVLVQQVTNQTLKIDKLSTLVLDFVDDSGNPIPNLPFHIRGAKRKYFNPDTYKYSEDKVADSNGHIELTDMEFDEYYITATDWMVAATMPYQPLNLSADSTLQARVHLTKVGMQPKISLAEPAVGTSGESIVVTVTGDTFSPSPTIKLKNASTEIIGTDVSVTGGSKIVATFDLIGASGLYDIVITNQSGLSITQYNGFEVKN